MTIIVPPLPLKRRLPRTPFPTQPILSPRVWRREAHGLGPALSGICTGTDGALCLSNG